MPGSCGDDGVDVAGVGVDGLGEVKGLEVVMLFCLQPWQ